MNPRSPDVSVIVAVYNTMPYLTTCLESLVGQTLDPARMEILAIDDGSTDGSGDELDRCAALHPGLVTVEHQPNSGGPAGPNNRALDRANGRYVYFVGADDHLGADALQRMVDEADANSSDVVVGKMVGVNGRYVHQALFKETDHDVDLFASALPWSMSNVKLFRRSVIEDLGLRFREDLSKGSDQPFALEACVRARKISVLADYDYYFAVTRTDSSNLTWSTHPDVDLACTAEIMHNAARLLPAGEQRDALLLRHFSWELTKLLTVGFLARDETVQERLREGVAELADDYLTEAICDTLPLERRVVLGLAQARDLAGLRAAVTAQDEGAEPPLHLERGRAFVAYPGFRSGPEAPPDRMYELVDGKLKHRLAKRVSLTKVEWQHRRSRPELAVEIRLALTGPDAQSPSTVRVRLVSLSDGATDTAVDPPCTLRCEAGTTVLDARVPVVTMLALNRAADAPLGLLLVFDVAGNAYNIPVTTGDSAATSRVWHRWREYRATAKAAKSGRLLLTLDPIARRTSVRRILRPIVPMSRRR